MRVAGCALVVAVSCVAALACRAFEPGFGQLEMSAVRSLHDQVAQRDAIVELRLDQLLPATLRAHGIDCWVVLGAPHNPDPLWPHLTLSGSQPTGRAVLVLCAGAAGERRLAIGRGLERNAGIYELVEADGAAVGEQLRIALHGASTVAVNRSESLSLADGLRATDEAWLQRVLAAAPVELTSSEGIVDDYLGRHLDVEVPLFTEAARLTVGLLHEVLADEIIVAPEKSVGEVAWALRERAYAAGLRLAFEPRVWLQRPGAAPASVPPAGLDPLLQAGDRLFVVAGLDYLGYSTRYGRWTYLPREEDRGAPPDMVAGLEDLAGRLESTVATLAAEPRGRPAPAVGGTASLRFGAVGHVLGPLPLEVAAAGVGRPAAGESLLRAGSLLAVLMTSPGAPLEAPWLALLEDVVVEADGARLVVPPQRVPWVVE